jgi:hypothetical protein
MTAAPASSLRELFARCTARGLTLFVQHCFVLHDVDAVQRQGAAPAAGTPEYMSIGCHSGGSAGRRDDIEVHHIGVTQSVALYTACTNTLHHVVQRCYCYHICSNDWQTLHAWSAVRFRYSAQLDYSMILHAIAKQSLSTLIAHYL